MLKKRFFFFVAGFSILIVVFNFYLVFASVSGASKIRMLSLSILLSIFEITVALFASTALLKSATRFSKKEKQFSLALNNIDYGVVLHNELNEVLFLNAKAEEFLETNFKDMAGINLSPEMSLRNQKLSKVISVIFYSKLGADSEKQFSVSGQEIQQDNKTFFLKTIKPVASWHKAPDPKSIIDTAYRLRTPLSEVKWLIKTLLEGSGSTFVQNQIDILKQSQEANENAIKLVSDFLDTYKKASAEEQK